LVYRISILIMDVQDVSAVDQFAALLKQAQVNAERAGRRKGEIPKDHAPAFFQLQSYMLLYQHRLRKDDTRHHMIATQVPAAYPPSTRLAAELKPISISEMKLETHHRGRSIVVRVMVPASRINAVLAIVEDDKGAATLLQVY